jgi:hypothetical protein
LTVASNTHLASIWRNVNLCPQARSVLNALAVDPTNPQRMLIAGGEPGPPSSCGIYRSTDGGNSWQPAIAGLLRADGLVAGTVDALWINPADPNEALAASHFDGIFRSTDGDSIVLVATLQADGVELFHSDDGGLTFTQTATTFPVSAYRNGGGIPFGGSPTPTVPHLSRW